MAKKYANWELETILNNPAARAQDLAAALGRSVYSIKNKRWELGAVRMLDGIPIDGKEKLIQVSDAATGEILIPVTTMARAAAQLFYTRSGISEMCESNKRHKGRHPYIVEELTPVVILAKGAPHGRF